MFTGKIARYGFAVIAVLTPVVAAVVIFGESGQASDAEHVLYATSYPDRVYGLLGEVFEQAKAEATAGDRADRFDHASDILEIFYGNTQIESAVMSQRGSVRDFKGPFGDGVMTSVNLEFYRLPATVKSMRYWRAEDMGVIGAACFELAAINDADAQSPRLRGLILQFNREIGAEESTKMSLDFCRSMAWHAADSYLRNNVPAILAVTEGLGESHPELAEDIATLREIAPILQNTAALGSASQEEMFYYLLFSQAAERVKDAAFTIFPGGDSRAMELRSALGDTDAIGSVVMWSTVVNLLSDGLPVRGLLPPAQREMV